jgi:hypothetical protein
VTKITKPRKARKGKLHTQNTKSTITIVGDSHARGIAGELLHQLDHHYKITGLVKPNAKLAEVLNTASKDLNKSDNLIVFGGSNDFDKQVHRSNITSLTKFLEDHQNTTIILAAVPLRYDVGIRSPINEQINSYNRNLHKIIKGKKHVKLINITPKREHYTRHGFHLNRMGKEVITKEIIKCLPTEQHNRRVAVLELPWKDEPGTLSTQSTLTEEIIILDRDMGNVNSQCDPTSATGNSTGNTINTNPIPINGLSNQQGGKQDENRCLENKQDIGNNPKSQRHRPKLRDNEFLWR